MQGRPWRLENLRPGEASSSDATPPVWNPSPATRCYVSQVEANAAEAQGRMDQDMCARTTEPSLRKRPRTEGWPERSGPQTQAGWRRRTWWS
eukprot:10029488-Alexandrium_andersonii.AAC.1